MLNLNGFRITVSFFFFFLEKRIVWENSYSKQCKGTVIKTGIGKK